MVRLLAIIFYAVRVRNASKMGSQSPNLAPAKNCARLRGREDHSPIGETIRRALAEEAGIVLGWPGTWRPAMPRPYVKVATNSDGALSCKMSSTLSTPSSRNETAPT